MEYAHNETKLEDENTTYTNIVMMTLIFNYGVVPSSNVFDLCVVHDQEIRELEGPSRLLPLIKSAHV